MTEVQYLLPREIDAFVNQLDHDQDGRIPYQELERQLDAVYNELQPDAKDYNLGYDKRANERHNFLNSLLGSEKKTSSTVDELKQLVAGWKIPSLEQDKQAAKNEDQYLKHISWGRRLRAIWAVDGPQYVFLAFVVASQIALGVWQCVKYTTGSEYQAALGWGVGFAKACAGALWPTMFFMLLSMSRWPATIMRRSYHISRVINWDLSQSFHVRMCCIAITLATLHAVGHLSGSLVFGSRPDRQKAVAALLGPRAVPMHYVSYLKWTSAWSGLAALGLFYLLAVLSMPYVRKRSYEIFQIGHLLMFPILGLLMAHGSAALLQFPMMGILLAIPTLFVFFERLMRLAAGLHKIPANLKILDDNTVSITCEIPSPRFWTYKAGQYILLQVPQISFFQWHPFTISTCTARKMSLHIKTSGNWTKRLRDLNGSLDFVGIDGPFGAPAQRFYDFDQSIIVGAGIGVTPFSGILTDLQSRVDTQRTYSTETGSTAKDQKLRKAWLSTSSASSDDVAWKVGALDTYRRVDFHWIVRDKNSFLWFSDLLNRISTGVHDSRCDINIHNHLTETRKDVSTHIYRWLLERHRTSAQPFSPLTGLVAPTHFGRPDFPRIMSNHYEDMANLFAKDKARKRKVGVFFCGAPIVGRALADLCYEMTLRGREDRSEIEYHFQIEVFG